MILLSAVIAVLATWSAPADYRALVDEYRKDGTPQVEQLLAWSAIDVEHDVSAALASSSPWSWEEFRAAAMLHTEAGLRSQRRKDGRAADLHIGLAQKLLDRVVELSRAQKDFAIRWYAVVPRMMRAVGGGGIGNRLEAYAESMWGHDAGRASYARGLGFESTMAREGVIPEPGETSVFTGNTRVEAYLVPAAEAFADALRQNPDLHAASLHLGRVRMLQGQRDEAASLLRAAVDDVDPAVGYLAALFLGSIEERNERYDAAETLYRDALRRIPWGQSAPFALSELLSRTGREAEARNVLARRFAADGIIEPLWSYSALPNDELSTRFDLLRMEVWK